MARKAIFGVYDTKYYEQCVGLFENLRDVSDFLGITISSLYSEMSRGNKIKTRYEIHSIKLEEI